MFKYYSNVSFNIYTLDYVFLIIFGCLFSNTLVDIYKNERESLNIFYSGVIFKISYFLTLAFMHKLKGRKNGLLLSILITPSILCVVLSFHCVCLVGY